MEVVVTTEAIQHAKLQSNRHYQQSNTQLLTGRCSFCRPTNSQSTEGKKCHIPETSRDKLTWVIKQVLLVWGQYLVEQICGDHSAYN